MKQKKRDIMESETFYAKCYKAYLIGSCSSVLKSDLSYLYRCPIDEVIAFAAGCLGTIPSNHDFNDTMEAYWQKNKPKQTDETLKPNSPKLTIVKHDQTTKN